MTATSGKQMGVGLRKVQIYELNASGYPKASGATAYEGASFVGAKTFTLTVPEPRKFTFPGEDSVIGTMYLPPQESIDGELLVSVEDMDIIALLSGNKKFTVGSTGEATGQLVASSNQGFEPLVGMLMYQRTIDPSTGLSYYRSYIFPAAQAIYAPSGMEENPADVRYKIAPSIGQRTLWGQALGVLTHGGVTAQGGHFMTLGRVNIASFLGDGTAVDFVFHVDRPALSAAKVVVYKVSLVNGSYGASTEVTSGITKLTTRVTFSTAPADDDLIVVFYEY